MKKEAPVTDRDDAIGRLLSRRMPQADPAVGGACLDPETLAAWFDEALSPDARREAEAHAARCERCQMLLSAMAQAEPVEPVKPGRVLPGIRWTVPALAAAAALLIWVNVGRRGETPDLAPTAPATLGEAPSAAAPPAITAQSQAPGKDSPLAAAKPRSDAGESSPRADRTLAGERAGQPADARAKALAQSAGRAATQPSEEPRSAASAAAANAAAAPAPSLRNEVKKEAAARESMRANRQGFARGPVTFSSPDGSIWRVAAADRVDRSSDRGATWTSVPLPATSEILAGASPLAEVVWLVGRAGVVLLSTDGRTWQRRSVPEPVDLASVLAIDAKSATATTTGGRTFTTQDGGLTWTPGVLQENPAAPF